jgi:hypothetical protein
MHSIVNCALRFRYLGSASPVLIQERKTKLEAYGRKLSPLACAQYADLQVHAHPSHRPRIQAVWPAAVILGQCGD